MDAITWIIIFMPIFLLFAVIWPLQRSAVRRIYRKRGETPMANELLQKFMGKKCAITTGSFGGGATGILTAVEDKWLEIQTKRGVQLFNLEYVTNIYEMK